MRERIPCVYILGSFPRGTLHTGVTSDLVQRVYQHKNNLVDGLTRDHHVHMLVWYELHGTMESAIQREKAIKAWKRLWKLELVEQFNSDWPDLHSDIL